MPCRTDPMWDAPKEDNTVSKQKYMALLAEANLMTKLLCAIEKSLDHEQAYYMVQDIPGLNEWYQKHAEEDRRRIFDNLRTKFPQFSEEQITKLIATGVFDKGDE